ncbi:MAG: hypothetical protein NVSMB30_25390 [Hymenobacter sp.]
MHEINSLTVAPWRLRGTATVALSISLLAPALAQQAPATIRLLPEDAQRGLNGHQQNFYFLPPGVEGEHYLSAGFFGQKLRPYLGNNAEALADLNLYKRQKTQFLIDRIVAISSFGVYGQQILAGPERQYFNSTQQVALGVFAAAVLGTVFINRNTNSYLQRAVGAFNASPAHGTLWPRLRPSGLEVGQARSGQALLGLRWAVR